MEVQAASPSEQVSGNTQLDVAAPEFSPSSKDLLITTRQDSPSEYENNINAPSNASSGSQTTSTVPNFPQQYPQLSVHSHRAFEQLQAQLRKRETGLEKKTRDLKAAQYNVTAAREETNKVKAKQDSELKMERDELLARHREELERLNMKADEDAQELKKVSTRADKFKTSNEKVKVLL